MECGMEQSHKHCNNRNHSINIMDLFTINEHKAKSKEMKYRGLMDFLRNQLRRNRISKIKNSMNNGIRDFISAMVITDPLQPTIHKYFKNQNNKTINNQN